MVKSPLISKVGLLVAAVTVKVPEEGSMRKVLSVLKVPDPKV